MQKPSKEELPAAGNIFVSVFEQIIFQIFYVSTKPFADRIVISQLIIDTIYGIKNAHLKYNQTKKTKIKDHRIFFQKKT